MKNSETIILVVDDEEESLDLIEAVLTSVDFKVYKAKSGQEAIDISKKVMPDSILLDIHMPEMDGYETFEKIKNISKLKNIPIIFITAKYLKIKEMVKGLEIGAYDYITKPFHNEELIARVNVSVKIKNYEDKIRKQLNELKKANRKLKIAKMGMINAMLSALELKDFETSRHCFRVTKLAVEIAKRLKLSKEQIDLLKNATLLHDIGKIGIEDKILKKPGKLNEEEFSEIKKHPKYGKIILNSLLSFKKVIEIILYHHERIDGDGYYKKDAEQIPLLSKIITVADSFDAMTSKRTYRTEVDFNTAVKELEDNINKQFDKDCVEALKNYLSGNDLL